MYRVKSLWQLRKQKEIDVRLWIYPDENGKATGYLYEDDGFTFDYKDTNENKLSRYNLYKFSYHLKPDGDEEFSAELVYGKYKGQRITFKVRVVSYDNEWDMTTDEIY